MLAEGLLVLALVVAYLAYRDRKPADMLPGEGNRLLIDSVVYLICDYLELTFEHLVGLCFTKLRKCAKHSLKVKTSSYQKKNGVIIIKSQGINDLFVLLFQALPLTPLILIHFSTI